MTGRVTTRSPTQIDAERGADVPGLCLSQASRSLAIPPYDGDTCVGTTLGIDGEYGPVRQVQPLGDGKSQLEGILPAADDFQSVRCPSDIAVTKNPTGDEVSGYAGAPLPSRLASPQRLQHSPCVVGEMNRSQFGREPAKRQQQCDHTGQQAGGTRVA